MPPLSSLRQCPHILSGCQDQIISGMITERHSISCRLIMKATEAGILGGCFVRRDIGSKDRLALQNLQIPVGSTNRSQNGSSLAGFLLSKDLLLAAQMLY